MEPSEKTAAFFYVTNSGSVTVRKNGDYIAKMIDIAEERMCLGNAGTGENALSTMNMDFESFLCRRERRGCADSQQYDRRGTHFTIDEFAQRISFYGFQ